MSYQIKMNQVPSGVAPMIDILDYEDKLMALLSPKLTDELNEIGTLEFEMPPIHRYYDWPVPLNSTVEVYEDGEMIWYGRVISTTTDYYRQKNVCCEGALGWFKDTVQRYHEYKSVSVRQFFRDLITNHNAMAPAHRQFTVGDITVEDATVYRKLDYETTYDCLMRMCVGAEGGYFFFRRSGTTNYIDWLKSMPYTCNQPVEFGLNLVDISATFDGADIVTAILPLGDTVQANSDATKGEVIDKTDPRVGLPLTLTHDYGSDILYSDLAENYGNIVEAVQFSGAKTSVKLIAEATRYMTERVYDRMSVECTAVELKRHGQGQNENYDRFRIGQMVKVRSRPHVISAEYPLIKLEIELDTAEKKVTLGTAPRQTLTKIVDESTQESGGQEMTVLINGETARAPILNFLTEDA